MEGFVSKQAFFIVIELQNTLRCEEKASLRRRLKLFVFLFTSEVCCRQCSALFCHSFALAQASSRSRCLQSLPTLLFRLVLLELKQIPY